MATHSNILAWEIPWSTVHGVAKGRTLLSDYACTHTHTYPHTQTHTPTHTYRIFNCFFYLPFSISIWKHQHHESFWSFLTLLSTSSFVTQLLLQFQSSFTQKWEAWTNRMGLLTLKIVMPKNSFISMTFSFSDQLCVLACLLISVIILVQQLKHQ